MKIICTVTNDLTYDQRMNRICSSLSTAGYEVWIIGRKQPCSIPLKNKAYGQKRLRCLFTKGKLFYLEYNLRLFFLLLFAKFDIVCSVDLDTILPGFLAAKWKKKICVFDAHEYFQEVPEVVDRPFTKLVWEKVARFTISKMEHCYTVCESLATLFEEKYGTHFGVIRNVPFRQKFKKENRKEKGKTVLLYQGVLNEGRGLEEIFHALSGMENTELWLAGEGDLSIYLRELAKKLALEKEVLFLGYLQPEDLNKVTKQATIGLNLLENKGLNYFYSLANKSFDYIQAGLPSINMNFPEYRKINDKFEVFLLLENLEPERIASAIRKLANEESFYQLLEANCQKARRELIWEKEERKLLQFYEEIFEQSKTSTL